MESVTKKFSQVLGPLNLSTDYTEGKYTVQKAWMKSWMKSSTTMKSSTIIATENKTDTRIYG